MARTDHSIAPWRTNPPEALTLADLDRVHDLVEAHASRRHALGVEPDLELAKVSAQPFNGRDAGNRQQPVAHRKLGEIPECHQIGGAGFRFQREFENLIQSPGHARQQRRFGPRRQLGSRLCHSLGDELTRAVVVRVRLEFDRDLTDPELRGGPNPADVRQPGQRGLHGDGDAGLEFLRAHRHVLHDDVEHRRGQVGEDISTEALQRHAAQDRSGQREDDGQRRLRERCARITRSITSVLLVLARGLFRFPPSAGRRRRPPRSRRTEGRRPLRLRPRDRVHDRPRRISKVLASFGMKTHQRSRTRWRAAVGTVEHHPRFIADGQKGRGRHPRTQEPVDVRQFDAHRNRAGLPLDTAPDKRHPAGKGLAGKRGERDARGFSDLYADGVTLERVHRQPDRCQVGNSEERLRRVRHLPQDHAPVR